MLIPLLQADLRVLPDDPKTVWGLDGADVERYVVKGPVKVEWKKTMTKIRQELAVEEAFDIYIRNSMQNEEQVLQALLLRHDSASDLLPGAVGDIMRTRTLWRSLERHDITEEALLACYERAVARSKGNWSALAKEIGNPKWKRINNNGTTLRKMFSTAGFDLTTIEWHVPAGIRCPRVRNKRSFNPETGELSIHHCQKRTARPLIDTLNATLETDEKLSLISKGRRTNINTPHLKRSVRDATSPLGWKREEYTREAFGRFVPITESLEQLINALIDGNILRPDVERLRISYWVDGSTLARLSTVLVHYRVVYEPGLLVDDSAQNVASLRAIQTWISIPMRERYDDLRRIILPLVAQELGDLNEANPPYRVLFTLQLADNKFHGCSSGVGGRLSL